MSRMIFAIAAALSVVLAGSNVVHATSHVALYSIKAKGSDLLWRILRDGRWGYMDRTGKIVIKPRFVRASDFFGGIASVCVPTASIKTASAKAASAGGVRCGYIDRSGAFVIQPRFKWAHDFKDDVAWVGTDDGATLINKDGEILTTNRFHDIEPFSEGLAAVTYRSPDVPDRDYSTRDLHGFVDTTGRIVVNTIYTSAEAFSEGLAAVENSAGLWGFIDAAGRVAIDFRFLDTSPFSGGVAIVRDPESGDWGVIDTSGRLVRPFNLSSADEFHEGVAAAGDENGMGLIGRDGRFLFQRSISRIETPREGLAEFTDANDRYGYLDVSGQVRVSPQYLFSEPFSESRAAVADPKTGLYGYVDPTGALIIPQRFGIANEFVDGLALVLLGDDFCYIDPQGHVVARDVWDGESY